MAYLIFATCRIVSWKIVTRYIRGALLYARSSCSHSYVARFRPMGNALRLGSLSKTRS